AHRDLHLFAGEGRRYVLHLDDPVRNVAWRVLLAKLVTDLAADHIGEYPAVGQHDEQRHEEAPAGKVEVDDDRVLALADRGQCRIDLRGPDPHAVAVEDGIRAPEHEAAATCVDPEEIPLAPYPGEVREIGLVVPAAVGVTPEADGHRRHRLG